MWRNVLHPGMCCLALFASTISHAQIHPTINIIAPTNMSRFPLGDSIAIFVDVSDPDGHVQVVQFLSGTNLIGTSQEPPFSFLWNNPPQGHHRLSAVAMDNSGRRGFSQYVYVKSGSMPSVASLVRGPYLQLSTPSNVVVRWRTDWPVDSKASYGTEPDSMDHSVADATPKTEHELQLPNLLPAATYYYSVGTSTNTFSEDEELFYFHTAPIGNKPTRIWIIGDSGTANQNAVNVRLDYEAFTGVTPTDVWLMLGDNAYEEGTDDEYQRAVFEMYRRMLRHTVLWPTLGNHDAVFRGQSGEFPYLDMFTLPQNGEAGGVSSGTEKYYSFDYSNIHFICLDSQTQSRKPGSAMLRWLEEDLAATAQDWIIAYWHHPPYTRGTYDSDVVLQLVEMRQYVLPLLEQYGVDLVFAGHSHVYERSYLLNGHYGIAGELLPEMILNSGYGRESDGGAYEKPAGGLGARQGAVYIVCGCSGEGGVTREFNHPAMRVSSGGFGSVVLDVNGLRLDAKFLRVPGEIYDYFTITKGPSSLVRPGLYVERATNLIQLSWPTSLSPFTLQRTDALDTTAQWFNVPESPFQFGRRNILRLPVAATNRFFRLRGE